MYHTVLLIYLNQCVQVEGKLWDDIYQGKHIKETIWEVNATRKAT